jgi:hypothetical protein
VEGVVDSTAPVRITRRAGGYYVSVRGSEIKPLPSAWLDPYAQYKEWGDGNYPLAPAPETQSVFHGISALCNPLRRALIIEQLGAISAPSEVAIGLSVRFVAAGEDPDRHSSIDTLYQGKRYRLMYRVRAHPSAARSLWLSVVMAGFSGPPLAHLTGDEQVIQAQPGAWQEIQTIIFPTGTPGGEETMHALVTAEPRYSLTRLRGSIPRCVAVATRFSESDAAATMWRSARYRYVVVPAKVSP